MESVRQIQMIACEHSVEDERINIGAQARSNEKQGPENKYSERKKCDGHNYCGENW